MKPERLVYHTICSNLNRIKYNSELDKFRPYTGSLHNKVTAPIFCFLFVVERSILRVKLQRALSRAVLLIAPLSATFSLSVESSKRGMQLLCFGKNRYAVVLPTSWLSDERFPIDYCLRLIIQIGNDVCFIRNTPSLDTFCHENLEIVQTRHLRKESLSIVPKKDSSPHSLSSLKICSLNLIHYSDGFLRQYR